MLKLVPRRLRRPGAIPCAVGAAQPPHSLRFCGGAGQKNQTSGRLAPPSGSIWNGGGSRSMR